VQVCIYVVIICSKNGRLQFGMDGVPCWDRSDRVLVGLPTAV
jgi:hypothetical protein